MTQVMPKTPQVSQPALRNGVATPVANAASAAPAATPAATADAKAQAEPDKFKTVSSGRAWKAVGRKRHQAGGGDTAPPADSKLMAEMNAARSGGTLRTVKGTAQAQVEASVPVAGSGAPLFPITPGRNQDLMAKIASYDDAKLGRMMTEIHVGNVPDRNVIMAVNIEQLARTHWGQNHKAEVDALRSRFSEGRLTFVPDADGSKKMSSDGFTDVQGNVKIDEKLMKSTTLVTTTLANEAVSLAKTMRLAAEGTNTADRGDYLAEEVASTIAEMDVYAELPHRVEDDAFSATITLGNRVDLRKGSGLASVANDVMEQYIDGYRNGGDVKKIGEILNGMKNHPEWQSMLTDKQGIALARGAAGIATWAAEELRGKGATPSTSTGTRIQWQQQAERLAHALRHASEDVRAAAAKEFAHQTQMPRADVEAAFKKALQ